MQMDRIDWNRVHLILNRRQKGRRSADKTILELQLQSPGPKPLVPMPHRPNPNPVQPNSKPKLVPRGLGLTLNHGGNQPNPSKIKVNSERKDTKQSTMFSENIIILSCCTIIKMPASRVDKFSAGRTKCRSPMQIRIWWNSPALFLLVIYKEYLNHTLGLTLSTPGLVPQLFSNSLPNDLMVLHNISFVSC